ncbi:SMP-30/Gluconolaconase/LRE-like region [Gemmata obscuriglobus]|uniref:Gluconolactonase n=1 Tax=Gemmata obscuriglobus TaxID=114 RepID=A0A2Z3GZE8_9BACT|nr:SMP-30/gluconolactonase/LRE family protein [Gemmata obscuriglobus]AWM38051.1 gluconolactonase [Gemmata obscuriglobus]QEG29076.1 SMP-30/Gluconolaconase/LRE-like region [Gemmata obscuriglobus]VTS07727.1 Gluconolactonase OS=Rhodopirellula baltica WH47 GN=RBWH47_02136 PE=4 SV=1: SGL [Gemmata obscuriglobus UQM 2246]
MRSTEAIVYIDFIEEEDRFLPEGPRWLTVGGKAGLAWVNIQLNSSAKNGELRVHFPDDQFAEDLIEPCPGRPGFALPIAGGNRMLVGVDKQLRVCDVANGKWSDPLATIPDDNPRTIINDAEIVPGGRAVVFGTKDTQFDEEAKLAQLYLYTPEDNRISLLAAKQVCSNGKVFATDDRGLVLYDIDTPTRKVVRHRLDVAARTAVPDGVALDLSNQAGFPDGMCDCGDGSVIVAFFNPDFVEAGRAVRFSLATGAALEEWTTPGSPRVTCPFLVKRPNGVKLILTTASEGMPADLRVKCPNAGCIFVASTEFADCPVPEFVAVGV